MAITRLERKGRKNVSRAKARVKTIKRLNSVPLIKNIDIEAIKAEFEKNLKAQEAPKKEKAPAKVVEASVAVEESVEEVVAVTEEVIPAAETKVKAKKATKKDAE
ncbi:MAG: hypothetical protein ACI8TA_001384 [Cyclobacteriaceae bacterium]|jgi:hypothetical protein